MSSQRQSRKFVSRGGLINAVKHDLITSNATQISQRSFTSSQFQMQSEDASRNELAQTASAHNARRRVQYDDDNDEYEQLTQARAQEMKKMNNNDESDSSVCLRDCQKF